MSLVLTIDMYNYTTNARASKNVLSQRLQQSEKQLSMGGKAAVDLIVALMRPTCKKQASAILLCFWDLSPRAPQIR